MCRHHRAIFLFLFFDLWQSKKKKKKKTADRRPNILVVIVKVAHDAEARLDTFHVWLPFDRRHDLARAKSR